MSTTSLKSGMGRTWKLLNSGAESSREGLGPEPRKLAYPPRSLQTWVTKKQTVTPIATGMSVATVVQFALRVSL